MWWICPSQVIDCQWHIHLIVWLNLWWFHFQTDGQSVPNMLWIEDRNITRIRCRYFLWISPGSEQVTDWHLSDFLIQMQHGGSSASGYGGMFWLLKLHHMCKWSHITFWQINDSEMFASSKTKVILGWHSWMPIISKFIFALGEL